MTGKADTSSYFISGNKFLVGCWSPGLGGHSPAGFSDPPASQPFHLGSHLPLGKAGFSTGGQKTRLDCSPGGLGCNTHLGRWTGSLGLEDSSMPSLHRRETARSFDLYGLVSYHSHFICMMNSVAVVWKFPKCKISHIQGYQRGGNKNQTRNLYFKIIYLHIIGMKTGLYICDGTGQIPYRNIQSIQKPLSNLNKMDKYISK